MEGGEGGMEFVVWLRLAGRVGGRASWAGGWLVERWCCRGCWLRSPGLFAAPAQPSPAPLSAARILLMLPCPLHPGLGPLPTLQ